MFDDLIIAGANDDEHDDTLCLVLEHAREVNIRFSKDKIQHKVHQVKYVGHIVSQPGIQPDPEKIKAIVDMKTPMEKNELQRFLGLLTYLSKFLPHFSDATAPLRSLLKKDVEWTWSEYHDKAYRHLKELIVAIPVLQFFDPSKPTTFSSSSSTTTTTTTTWSLMCHM